MTDAGDLRTRLEDVHAELEAIEDDLPEPLNLSPAIRCVGSTLELCQLIEIHGRMDMLGGNND